MQILNAGDDLWRSGSIFCYIFRIAQCSQKVKITLFQVNCLTLYTSNLYTKHIKQQLDTLKVQCNNYFRMLSGLLRFRYAHRVSLLQREPTIFTELSGYPNADSGMRSISNDIPTMLNNRLRASLISSCFDSPSEARLKSVIFTYIFYVGLVAV